MSTPSVAAVVTAIRDQLSTAISPALADDRQKKLLAVIDHLLHTIAVRSEHEIDWMVGQTADVVELAQRFVAAGAAPEPVATALQRYRDGHRPGLATSVVTANFALAAEVLSTVLEATSTDDGEIAVTARELMARDVQRGIDIVGDDFKLVTP
jgi:hypothetical protein